MQTYLVKPSSDIDGAVLNDFIHDLRQRGLEVWVTKLKQKKKNMQEMSLFLQYFHPNMLDRGNKALLKTNFKFNLEM